MDSNAITAIATGFLVLVGFVQILLLKSQRRQEEMKLIEEYRKRWISLKTDWGVVIYIGRNDDEYYQVLPKAQIDNFNQKLNDVSCRRPTTWILDSSRVVFSNLSDVCIRILQGQLNVGDVYPIFGSELLRHSRPLRVLLDNGHHTDKMYNEAHRKARKEVQDWLIYHDGIRRRCLILIDLLWAEATRLEDIPPEDIKNAADAKSKTGYLNRKRLSDECDKLNRHKISFLTFKLSRFLRNSEYQQCCSKVGINKKRLQKLEREWTNRLLRNFTDYPK